MVLLVVLFGGQSNSDAPAKLSSTPLDADRIAIYRAFVAGYMTGPPATINLAPITSAFAPDKDDFEGCMKGFLASPPILEVHSLAGVFAGDKHVKLVDPAKHQIEDPEDGIRKGQSVDNAVNQGFDAALMTLSEIMFDSSRTHAALSYSFHCGRLCGNGGTVLYKRKAGKWVASKRSCGSWIS
jgi:hypothetical protein